MMNLVYNQKTNNYGYTQSPSSTSRVNKIHAINTGTSLIVPMQSVATFGATEGTAQVDADSLQFVNQYQDSMREVSAAADRLRALHPGNVWERLEVSSSDTSSAEVRTTGNVTQLANYAIDVKQLASSQISTTQAVVGTDLGGFTSGDFTLTTGRTDADGNPLTGQFTIDSALGDNQTVLADVAKQIEAQFNTLGIHASVVSDTAGNAQLRLESVDTGTKYAFSAAGGGGAMQLEQQSEAKNLIYSVSKNNAFYGKDGPPLQEYGSNNFVKIDGGTPGDGGIHNKAIQVDFKKTGRVEITAGVDSQRLTELTEDFVNKYNDAVDLLVDNAHRGKGVEQTRDRFLQAPVSKDAMASIGLSWGEDGRISLDKKAFADAVKSNPNKVYDVLSDHYSVTDTTYQKAQNAQKKSSASLLSNSPAFSTGSGGNGGGITIINNYFYNLPLPGAYFNPFMFRSPAFFNLFV